MGGRPAPCDAPPPTGKSGMRVRDKIKTREELALLCDGWRREGKRIGFTSGSFDLLHAGHATYLEKAKEACDVLLVGVNDDASVKSYKGDLRPINPQEDRVLVIASLACVDYAFLFPERRNQANIQALKPDRYIKAGDYAEKDLSSARFLEPWGGKVELIPFLGGRSTTSVIQRIVEVYGAPSGEAASLDLPEGPVGKAVFLDRDGVINREVEYLHEPEKFELLPGVLEAVKALRAGGYKIVVATLQAGIGLGYFTKEDFFKVNQKMLGLFHRAGIAIDKVYFCPHGKADGCACRKPEPGMLRRGVEELRLDASKCFMVGDKTSDMEAGRRAGMGTVLVKTGHGGRDAEFPAPPDHTADDLLAAANWILSKVEAGPTPP